MFGRPSTSAPRLNLRIQLRSRCHKGPVVVAEIFQRTSLWKCPINCLSSRACRLGTLLA